MQSIRTKIITSFLVVIVMMMGFTTAIMVINRNLINKYQEINANIVYEQELKDSIWSMVEYCYNDFKSGDFTNYENELKRVKSLEKILDQKTNTNKDTYAAYLGVKKSLDAVVREVADAKSVWEVSGGTQGSSAFFETVGAKFEYVKLNTTDLILAETKNIAAVSQEIQRTQRYLDILIGSTAIMVIVVSIIYAIYFANNITNPIITLSAVAKTIADGDLSVHLDSKLLNVSGEIGSLSTSFNTMLQTLIHKFHELSKERDKAKTLVVSIPSGILAVDEDANITTLNKAAEDLLGIDAREYIGKQWSTIATTLKDGKEVPLQDRTLVQVLQSGETIYTKIDDNHSYKTHSGKIFPIVSTTVPIKSGGMVIGAIKVFQDATEEKEQKEIIEKKVVERTMELRLANEEVHKGWFSLQKEKAKLSASIENMPVGFMMTDLSGNLLVVNALAHKHLGANDDEEAYTILKKILDKKVDVKAYLAECNESSKTLIFNDIHVSDGRYLKVFISPILSDDISHKKICTGIVVLIDDVTEVKIMERSKDEFFSIASHELRTPLTAIRGNTSLMMDMYAEKLKDPELMEMMNDVHDSAIRLINIVNDFLNVSRLEMGKIEFKKINFDLVSLTREVLDELKDQADQKKLTLRMNTTDTPSFSVVNDRDRTKEVLINLIGNAIKYTDTGEIRVDVVPSPDMVRVRVADMGTGISPEGQKLLFHKFQQTGDSLFTRDTTKGTGLGLYISKLLVEGMGGKIWLDKSEKGKGSVFIFSLPVANV